MEQTVTHRIPSASAPKPRSAVQETARKRILRALELGRRGQLLRQLNPDARSRPNPGVG